MIETMLGGASWVLDFLAPTCSVRCAGHTRALRRSDSGEEREWVVVFVTGGSEIYP